MVCARGCPMPTTLPHGCAELCCTGGGVCWGSRATIAAPEDRTRLWLHCFIFQVPDAPPVPSQHNLSHCPSAHGPQLPRARTPLQSSRGPAILVVKLMTTLNTFSPRFGHLISLFLDCLFQMFFYFLFFNLLFL